MLSVIIDIIQSDDQKNFYFDPDLADYCIALAEVYSADFM